MIQLRRPDGFRLRRLRRNAARAGMPPSGWRPDEACDEIFFFCDYWTGLKGEAKLPAGDLIDPLDFHSCLSRVFVVEGGRLEDLRVRLAGTVYRDVYGFEIAGKLVAELIPFINRPDLLVDYERCLSEQVPVYYAGKMNWRPHGWEVSYERILLPFGSRRGVEKILGFAQFFDHDGRSLFN